MIERDDPVILDVRTRREYARAHLAGSILIPLQELQARIGELSGHKDREILVYCATGNRSTVAAKILIDSGFNRIYNMRRGIAGWGQEKMPVVR
jgi:rhodanese-related sulfurtransferase